MLLNACMIFVTSNMNALRLTTGLMTSGLCDQAGAHYLAESVADLLTVLEEIEGRLSAGECPGQI